MMNERGGPSQRRLADLVTQDAGFRCVHPLCTIATVVQRIPTLVVLSRSQYIAGVYILLFPMQSIEHG